MRSTAAATSRLSSPVAIALAALAPDVDRQLEHALDALAGLGADRDDRREVEERQPRCGSTATYWSKRLVGLVLDEVPLVDRDDEALALLDDVAGDVGVLRRQPVDGVDDEDRDVGARDRLEGPQRGVALGRRPRGDLAALRMPAVSIRTTSLRPQGIVRVDRVAGGARDLR